MYSLCARNCKETDLFKCKNMHQTTSGWFNFAKVLPDFSYYIYIYIYGSPKMKQKIILNRHGWCESIKSSVSYIVTIALWANPSILRKSSLWILSLKHPHTHITNSKNILLMEFHDEHFRLCVRWWFSTASSTLVLSLELPRPSSLLYLHW